MKVKTSILIFCWALLSSPSLIAQVLEDPAGVDPDMGPKCYIMEIHDCSDSWPASEPCGTIETVYLPDGTTATVRGCSINPQTGLYECGDRQTFPGSQGYQWITSAHILDEGGDGPANGFRDITPTTTNCETVYICSCGPDLTYGTGLKICRIDPDPNDGTDTPDYDAVNGCRTGVEVPNDIPEADPVDGPF
jgi:hypothetical protein